MQVQELSTDTRLWQAIIAANTDTASGAVAGECPAGSGADTIMLPAGAYALAILGLDEDAALTGDLNITGDATIALADSSLGMIIVDAEGKTLYGFTNDTAGESTCYDQCEQNWPPLLATDPAAIGVGEGLDASLLTTVARTDGTMQVKYGDWPLYYFAADAAAGDTNGQGVGEVWFVVGADGALIQ